MANPNNVSIFYNFFIILIAILFLSFHFCVSLVTRPSENQQKQNVNFRTLYNLHPQDQR